MSKKKATSTLTGLICTLFALNLAVLPQLGFFMKVGSVDSMFQTGKMVGGALAQAFGNSLFEFIGIVLFLA